jgi:WD40 repeat protein
MSGSWDNTVRVWDAVSGKEKHTLSGHTSAITSVAFSPNSSQIISGSYDRTVRVWDAVSGKEKHTLSGYPGAITSVAFSPDGSQIILRSWDNTVRIWDTSTGTLQDGLHGEEIRTQSVSVRNSSDQGLSVTTSLEPRY